MLIRKKIVNYFCFISVFYVFTNNKDMCYLMGYNLLLTIFWYTSVLPLLNFWITYLYVLLHNKLFLLSIYARFEKKPYERCSSSNVKLHITYLGLQRYDDAKLQNIVTCKIYKWAPYLQLTDHSQKDFSRVSSNVKFILNNFWTFIS